MNTLPTRLEKNFMNWSVSMLLPVLPGWGEVGGDRPRLPSLAAKGAGERAEREAAGDLPPPPLKKYIHLCQQLGTGEKVKRV